MSHFVTPAVIAVAAALAVSPALAQGVARAPMFVGMLIIDDPTVADEALLPPVVYQPQTGGGDPWQGPFDVTVIS